MSTPCPPQQVKLIMSLLTADPALLEPVCEELRNRFGPIDFMSASIPFRFTRYYEEELGPDLSRRIISFQTLIAPDMLSSIKLATNALEHAFSREPGRRSINIDPGYIALAHLILATCKGFSHRPYLRDGVYADLTLLFREKSFQPLAWTFPDYGSQEMIHLLNTIRSIYLNQLRQGTAPGHGNAATEDIHPAPSTED